VVEVDAEALGDGLEIVGEGEDGVGEALAEVVDDAEVVGDEELVVPVAQPVRAISASVVPAAVAVTDRGPHRRVPTSPVSSCREARHQAWSPGGARS
jgi:hypothetical protein